MDLRVFLHVNDTSTQNNLITEKVDKDIEAGNLRLKDMNEMTETIVSVKEEKNLTAYPLE